MITSTILVVLFSTVVSSIHLWCSFFFIQPAHMLAIFAYECMLFAKVFGLMTKPLLCWLLPPHLNDMLEPETPNLPRVSSGGMHVPLLEEDEPMHQHHAMDRGSTAHILRRSSSTVHHFWRKFDDSFMRPVFGGRGFVLPIPRSQNTEMQDSTSSNHINGQS